MNLFDITPADIERWKKGLRIPELTDRDSEVRKLIGEDHFGFRIESYLKADYAIPVPTEADIIAYLQASEVPPSQWHPAAQEWARRHNGRGIWQYKEFYRWTDSGRIYGYDGKFYTNPHRLRADYGNAKEPIIAQPCYKPSDVSYGPFTLEPEVCVWKKHCDANTCYTDPHGELCFMPIKDINKGRFCPVCGKRIEVKNDRLES